MVRGREARGQGSDLFSLVGRVVRVQGRAVARLCVFSVSSRRLVVGLPQLLSTYSLAKVVSGRQEGCNDLSPPNRGFQNHVHARSTGINSNGHGSTRARVARLQRRRLRVQPRALVVSNPRNHVFLYSYVHYAYSGGQALVKGFLRSLGNHATRVVSVCVIRFHVVYHALLVVGCGVLQRLTARAYQLVRVVPCAIRASISRGLVIFSPPITCFTTSGVQVVYVSQPGLVSVNDSLYVNHGVSIFFTFFARGVIQVSFNSQVGSHGHFGTLFFCFHGRVPEFSMLYVVPYGRAVPVRVVGIGVGNVAQGVRVARVFYRVASVFYTLVTPTTLLMSGHPSLQRQYPPNRVYVFFGRVHRFFSARRMRVRVTVVHTMGVVFQVFFTRVRVTIRHVVGGRTVCIVLFLTGRRQGQLMRHVVILVIYL